MTLEEALALLRAARTALKRRGVARAAVFGSVARGEATANSDVDVFVEISPKANVGLWELAGVYNEIADAFPVKVDVAEFRALRAHVREEAERDAVFAF